MIMETRSGIHGRVLVARTEGRNGKQEVEFMEEFQLLVLKAGTEKDLQLLFVFNANLNERKSSFHIFAASNAYTRNMKLSSV